MSMPKSVPLFTVDDYLRIERAAEERHEFLDGEIYAMAGESDAHGDISVNVVITLGNQLSDSPCRVRTKDTKVRSGPTTTPGRNMTGLYSYPDILVICGDPLYLDEFRDVILNPKVIVEILSPATEAFDRGEKCNRYQTWNPTLTDYLLVSHDTPLIEHYTRNDDGGWSFKRYKGVDASVPIASIQCVLKLADVYRRVTFAEE